MMFALRRLLIAVVLAVTVYCLWPRTPSLTGFYPDRIAELQVTAWRKTRSGQGWDLTRVLYSTYAGQYGVGPVSALMMANDESKALRIFQAAPDAADQEKALDPLVKVYVALKSQVRGSFDAIAAAQMEFQIWGLRAGNRSAELASAISEKLALLYGMSPDELLPAAKKFALSMKAADAGRWLESRQLSEEAWKTLQSLAKPPAPLKEDGSG